MADSCVQHHVFAVGCFITSNSAVDIQCGQQDL